MEKHTCKLCFRHFSNGRALGGHMRSHMAAVPAGRARVLLPESSASSFSTSSREAAEEDEEAGDGKGSGLSYVLRENPRKSFRLVDPEFSSSFAFAAAVDAGSSVVQDRESETESPRAPSLQRRRSKRPRRGPPPLTPETAEREPEPASSVSDTTPEEDVAICLMMLSRDVWASGFTGTKSADAEDWQSNRSDDHDDDEEEQIDARSNRSNKPQQQQQRRSRYQCETCKKSFRSYQALGGHRASHKKLKSCSPAAQVQIPDADSSRANADRGGANGSSKVHECPVCFRVFVSGQALGGHKRSHLSSSATATITITSSPSLLPPPSPPSTSPATISKYGDCSKYGESLIDLNLPAPMDDDVPELSAVSDAEFVVRQHPFH